MSDPKLKQERPCIHEELRGLREALGLRISEAARLVGVSRTTFSLWENGHREPSVAAVRLLEAKVKLRRIAEAL